MSVTTSASSAAISRHAFGDSFRVDDAARGSATAAMASLFGRVSARPCLSPAKPCLLLYDLMLFYFTKCSFYLAPPLLVRL